MWLVIESLLTAGFKTKLNSDYLIPELRSSFCHGELHSLQPQNRITEILLSQLRLEIRSSNLIN